MKLKTSINWYQFYGSIIHDLIIDENIFSLKMYFQSESFNNKLRLYKR